MSDHDLHDLAMAQPDIPYRHMYAGLFDADLAEFGAKLAAKLNDMARLGGTVIHISINTISAKDGALHVGHIVCTLPKDQRTAVADVRADDLAC